MKLNKTINILFYLVAILVLFFNLGHVGIPRQGTEGFYLKILSEMSSMNSYLTPLYLGAPHWSKPPVQFWMALPFNEIFGMHSITAGRLAVLLFSLFALYLSSDVLSRYLKFSKANIFFFMLASFGVLKFFRIYMMENPLSLGIFLTSIFYFDFLQSHVRKYLVISIFWGAFTFLVKGPISFAICGLSFFLFHLFDCWQNKWNIKLLKSSAKNLTIYSLSTLFLASLWFIAEFYQYGMSFFNYFFLRENLGKFTSQSYSPIVLFQGLAMFALPWILFISKDFFQLKKTPLSPFLSFNFISFLVSFSIWFIPSQRSHHYAMPSLFFFLTILLMGFEARSSDFFSLKLKRSTLLLISLFLLVPIILLIVVLKDSNYLFAFVALVLSVFILFYYFSEKSITRFAQTFFILFTLIWYGLIPELSLPPLSDSALTFLNQYDDKTPIYLAHRKPFFIEEYAQVKVNVIEPSQVNEKMMSGPSIVIFPTDQGPKLDESLIQSQWPTWKRGISVKEALHALSTRNFEELYEYYTLAFRPKQ